MFGVIKDFFYLIKELFSGIAYIFKEINNSLEEINAPYEGTLDEALHDLADSPLLASWHNMPKHHYDDLYQKFQSGNPKIFLEKKEKIIVFDFTYKGKDFCGEMPPPKSNNTSRLSVFEFSTSRYIEVKKRHNYESYLKN